MAKETYKKLSDELQKVMQALEEGDLDIDEAVDCYERGLQIVRQLEDYLRTAENKVIQLKTELEEDDDE